MFEGDLMNLRTGIGKYIARDGKELAKNALTLHDLGELIRRTGLDAGFIVESQFSVPRAPDGTNVRKIDWVWLHANSPNPVVAFEIEGRDLPLKSLKADIRRLGASRAAMKVIALYQVDHNRTMMALHRGGNPKQWVRERLGRSQIDIMLDEDLMAKDGIEKLVRAAKALIN